jgi:Mg2+/Co2+ transporter CorB
MTILVLIFAEVLPKTYAITNAELAAARVAGFIQLIIKALSPIVASVRFLVRLILRIFGVKTDPNSHILAVREEIAGAIQLGHSEGFVEKEDKDLILGALDLSDRTVEEIMLHRSNIEMINSSDEPTKILTQCLESVHTRLPVFLNDPDNIVGVIHAKDLAREMYKLINQETPNINHLNNFDIGHVAMKPYFVPDTTSLDDQMRQFLHRRAHFALVVDEYGSLQGLITLEDILEEIVGEISDEFDPKDSNDIVKSNDGSYILEGSTTIRDLNRANEWSLPDDEAHTLAGLVIHEAQMIPTVGQVFRFHGYRFEIIERHANRITSIKVIPI